MERPITKTIKSISLGFVVIVAWAFLWVRAETFFPVNTEEWRLGYLLTYLVFFTLVFSYAAISGTRIAKGLNGTSFIRGLPVFVISATITFAILLAVAFSTGTTLNSISTALSYLPVGVLLAYALFTAFGEELIFREWMVKSLTKRQGIPKNRAVLIQSVLFSAFHAFMGKSLVVMVFYIPFGILLYKIKERYSPESGLANTGVHFSWDIFILGFLR